MAFNSPPDVRRLDVTSRPSVQHEEGRTVPQQKNANPVNHPPGRHYQVHGHRLWVETEGDGPPLVLLAGFGPAGSHVIFHPFFTGLASTHRLIYVDLYGRGRSDQPADLADITFAVDVADMAELISRLRLGPNATQSSLIMGGVCRSAGDGWCGGMIGGRGAECGGGGRRPVDGLDLGWGVGFVGAA
jgi:hypothetical protein